MTMDYLQFISELKNAHSDTIEIIGEKLRQFVSTPGSTTFNLSTGDHTVPNIPNVIAGTQEFTASGTIAKGDPLRVFDDDGVMKVRKINEAGVITSTMTSQPVATYYNPENNRLLYLIRPNESTIQGRICSIGTEGQLTEIGSAFDVITGATAIVDPTESTEDRQIVTVEPIGDCFVVGVLDGTTLRLRGGKFTDENTCAFGTAVTVSSVLEYDLSSNNDDKLGMIIKASDTYRARYQVFDFDANTYAISGGTLADLSGDSITEDRHRAINISYESGSSPGFHFLYNVQVSDDSILRHRKFATSLQSSTDLITLVDVAGSSSSWHPVYSFHDGTKLVSIICSYLGSFPFTLGLNVVNINTEGIVSIIRTVQIGTHARRGQGPRSISAGLGADGYVYLYHDFSTGGDNNLWRGRISVDFGAEAILSSRLLTNRKPITTRMTVDSSLAIYWPYESSTQNIYRWNFDRRPNFMGIAMDDKTNGQTVDVALVGSMCGAFTGLFVGAVYYIQSDMTIGLQKTPFRIGVAISPTTIKLEQ